MNRAGCVILGLLALAGAGVASRVRFVDAPPAAVSRPPAPDSMAEKREPAHAMEGLVIPVEGVRDGQLVDTFDDARGGGTRGHGALDIMAPRGTPVIAAAPGVIEQIFESKAGGHTVYVRVDGGAWVHYYAHLDTYAPALAEGRHVDRGERLGTVGSTGNADPAGPHLHFEIKRMAPGEKWYQGTGVNPYPLLSGNAGRRRPD
ncbi:Peptidase family M23 [Sphingomonas laterariae]|uniref:Peptidase family M23 n=1 Tax=Edaphosphingomonas laterariae TaxID=861865 RepID=A0A239DQ77_9SPHN|nr:M23 family metallopeptidase [Sphingomonas laterariae]SNS33912.1 Peptidase family M23 [Sphingomonas laterariae]